MKVLLNPFFIFAALLSIGWLTACQNSLTEDEILDADRAAIEAYVAANQLEGEFTSDDIFIHIEDTGIYSLQIDTLTIIDTIFVDTFFVDTLMVDSIIQLDTILVDTQLFKSEQLDSTFFFDFPSNSDTVLLSFELFTLEDQLVFGTSGAAFQVNDSTYPTLSQLLRGLEKGLQSFAKEGKGTLLIPSEEAYGRAGNGDLLPPNTPIRIDLHLLDFY